MSRIYYAHPMSWYDSLEEKNALEVISNYFKGCKIINPNNYEFRKRVKHCKKKNVMEIFLHEVRNCDTIVFSSFKDGYLGAGVAREVLEAILHEKEIYRVKGEFINKYQDIMFPILSISKTRHRIYNGIK